MERSRFFSALPAEGVLKGDTVPVHDPSMTRRADGTYVVFDTDIDFEHGKQFLKERCSQDLNTWHSCGYVFSQIPGWVRAKYSDVEGLWAPDISYFHGLYHLYYCVSVLGSHRSAIGLVTNATLDPGDPRYRWVDQGEILGSTNRSDFNAIDANILVERAQGTGEPRVWMTYGSFWKGIFQQEIDPVSGKLLDGAQRFHLAEQPLDRNGAVEGSAMIEHNGWFYLFASVGICCALPIERDTYQEIVGRSRSMHGPFLDERGRRLLDGGGTVLLSGDSNWIGPGGASPWQSADGQDTLLTFHALHRRENGALTLWVERVAWKEDWPVLEVLP